MSTDPMIGRTLARTIQIQRKIGSGGMGSVYEGLQEHLGRKVAVKVMSPDHARNPVAAEYFLREARAASQLRHPNIIQIFDFGTEDDNTIFLAMELVPGISLGRLLQRDFPLDHDRIVTILDQTLAGLTQAHRKHLVHRDLKPDNLMIEEIDGQDFVKILDFGIAQSQAEDRVAGPLTQANMIVGTPHYMSPEQARSARVDARSDLYSLGVILYQMLTNVVPFDAGSTPEILYEVLTKEPPPPSVAQTKHSIDAQLEAICLRAIKKDPALRYQSAEEFRDALRQLAEAPPQPRFIAPQDHDTPDPLAVAPITRELFNAVAAPPTEVGLAAAAHALDEGGMLSERATITAVVLHQRTRERFDPEQLADLRDAIDDEIALVAKQLRGQVLTRQGAFTTVAFGLPIPSTNDAQRAAHAALTLREQLKQVAPAGTTFSIALAAGEIYCPANNIQRASGAAIDDATDLARAGDDDEIAVAPGDLPTRLEELFELTGPAEDGRRRLHRMRNVDRVAHNEVRVELIGRDAEIARILGAFSRLNERSGTLLAVHGEAGVGKSALLDEIVATADQRQLRVLRARWSIDGHEAVRIAYLQWLKDVILQLGYSLESARAALHSLHLEDGAVQLLTSFVSEKLDDTFGTRDIVRTIPEHQIRAREAVRVAMRRVLTALTLDAPIVITLDGVDAPSGALDSLLREWARLCSTLPVLFVVGSRVLTAPDLPGPVETILLGPLSERASIAYLKSAVSTMPDDVAVRLARLSSGYPMHLDHLSRMARAPNFDIESTAEALAATTDIAELLRGRISAQPRTHQNVLAMCAALGDGAFCDHLSQLCPPAWDVDATLKKLQHEGLIEVVGTVDTQLFFRPKALEHVIYNHLSQKVLRQLHQRARAFYEERVAAQGDRATRQDRLALIRHLERDGAPQPAYEALQQLIRHTFGEHDYDAAEPLLQRAITLLRRNAENAGELARQHLQLARVERALGNEPAAVDRCTRLLRRSEVPPDVTAEARIEIANIWLTTEDPDLVATHAKTTLHDVRKLQEASPTNERLQCLLVLALRLSADVALKQRKFPQASALASEAVAILERNAISPTHNPVGPDLVWETLLLASRVRLEGGDPAGAQKVLERARYLVASSRNLRGQVAITANIAAALNKQGDIERSYKEMSDALRLAHKLGAPMIIAKLQHNRGSILRQLRRYDMAIDALRESLSLAEDLDWREGIARAQLELGQIEMLHVPRVRE